ncbi:hexosyltransferase-like protein 2 [Parvularcula bermudensis HTCC2503]|uniref:Hexosyltransferase-like protein 2 n=1 Tax=Parvularcula bermudensis (strain ATCC BAA-594 / HTCC2503 / KCTC 12087) TaxID=314260 RepID=E0TC44_PARBH|nr:glycosyltransferase family 4 protein [Parvularcula bermudensis]ADM10302.1 hexosyltransferase-like protein 2 [Parvularcula bermudensis HTCC2503]
MRRVFAYGYRPVFQRANTDISYMRSLSALSSFTALDVQTAASTVIDVTENARILSGAIGRRLGRGRYPTSFFSSAELAALQRIRRHTPWEVFYTNGRLPASDVLGPVIRFDYIHEPDEIDAPAKFMQDVEAKRAYARHCAGIQVATETQKRLFARIGIPEAKIFVVPFFLPQVSTLSETAVEAKHQDDRCLRIAFVGHQARRKGLPALLEALQAPHVSEIPWELTIVSKMLDGPVSLPQSDRISYHEQLPRDEVLSLFSRAHVLAVPSLRETFGLVYVEAMASGAVPILAAGPQQRELSAEGEVGFPVGPDPKAIAESLRLLGTNRSDRMRRAQKGRELFLSRYHPAVVAEAYRLMVERICQ